MLKDEAICRGIEPKRLPKTKASLLDFLVDGSVHLKETRAWQEVEAVKAELQTERMSLLVKANEAKQELERVQRIMEMERERVHQQEYRKTQELEGAKRAKEVELQRALHTHSFPMVHSHPLARTKELKENGVARLTQCNNCTVNRDCLNTVALWTCESCDFDVCRECFDKMNMTQEEKDTIRARQSEEHDLHLAQKAQRQNEKTSYKAQLQKAIDEKKDRNDASQQFKKEIICPPASNKDVNGTRMNGFTVYCTSGNIGDQGVEFDSTWTTAVDANARARYRFIWENFYGGGPDEIGPYDEVEINGLKKFSTTEEYSPWTVSVVPDVAFPHLQGVEQTDCNPWARQKKMEEKREPIDNYDASQQFKKEIIRPPASNKDINGTMMKGFTVCCTRGYIDEQAVEFDSTWKTAVDANSRAHYLFIWENTFGIEPEEIGDYDESETNGLKKYSSNFEDGSPPWTVSVVPDVGVSTSSERGAARPYRGKIFIFLNCFHRIRVRFRPCLHNV